MLEQDRRDPELDRLITQAKQAVLAGLLIVCGLLWEHLTKDAPQTVVGIMISMVFHIYSGLLLFVLVIEIAGELVSHHIRRWLKDHAGR